MSSKPTTIAEIKINVDCPTDLSFDDLHTWVIWQFPKKRGTWLCGAVRPPLARHSWLPALIKQKERMVQVHGHTNRDFDTPAEAMEWLLSNKRE